MADNNMSGSVGLDTTAFKTGVTQLTAQIKSIETGFKASAAVMDSWSTTSEGLSSRTSSLSEKLGLQKQALNLLHEQYDKVVASEGANSKSAESLTNQMYDMQQKIASTKTSLERYTTQLKTVESQEKENTSSISKFKSGLSSLAEQSQKSTSKITSHFGSLKGVIAGFGMSLVASLSLNTIISAADSAEKTMAQMDAVLTSTGSAAGMTKDQLVALASAQAKVTTYSAGATKQAENMLLTFTNIKSDVFPQTIQAAEDMATAMGMDATDAAKTLGKALNDPAAGLSKLTKQGVTFTDAQKEQIKAMQAAGDTAGAQKIILAELTKEFGGSAVAAGSTLSGQITIAKNNIKSIGTTAAMAIMPIVTDLMPALTASAASVADFVKAHKGDIQNAVTTIGDTIKSVLGFIEQHGTIVKGTIIGIVSAMTLWKSALIASNVISGISNALMIAKALSTGGATAAQAALTAATGSTTAAQMLLNASMLANPITAIVVGIAALVAGFVILWNKSDAFRNFWIGLWGGIKNAAMAVGSWFSNDFVNFFKNAWNRIVSFFTGIPAWFNNLWNNVKSGAVSGINGVTSGIVGAWGGVTSFFTQTLTNITTTFNNIKNAIMAPINAVIQWFHIQIMMQLLFTDSIFNKIKSAILSIWEPIKNGLATAFDGIKQVAQGAWELIKNVILAPVLIIADLITGNFGQMKLDIDKIWSNIKEATSTMWNGIKEYFSGIWTAVYGSAAAFGVLFANGLVTIWNGVTATIKTVWSSIATFFANTWTNISLGLTTFWNGIPTFFTNLWMGLKTGISTAWTGFLTTIQTTCENIKSGIINIWSGVLAWFNALPSTLMAIGSNMFTSMQTGISSTIQSVTTAIQSGIGAAIDWIKEIPSEALQWGKDIIQGIVDGIESAASAVGDAVSGVAQNIRSFLHFSVPDEGPLSDFDTYMPDMMSGLANGMTDNLGKVREAASSVAGTVSIASPAVATANTKQNSNGSGFAATNAVISAINMMGSKIASASGGTAQAAGNISLDGISVGRVSAPYVIKEFKRLGMVDSDGYIRVT